MSKSMEQNKNLWRSKKPTTFNQPVTEILNQCQKRKKQTRLNLSEIKPPQSLKPSMFIDQERIQNFQNDLLFDKNKYENNKHENLKFEIKCEDRYCEMDDVMSVISCGGYSVKQKYGKQKKIVHNHRKINKQTAYYFIEDEIPYLDIKNEQNDFSEENKSLKEWQKSPFAPLFYTKLDNFNNLKRQTQHHEKRQKEILQNYERDQLKQIEKQKLKQAQKKTFCLNQRRLKQNPIDEVKNQAKMSQVLNSQQNLNEKEKIKTRQQERLLKGDNFEMSKLPLPTTKHCYPCKIKFQNYKEHIESSQHRLNVQKALGNSYFIEEMNSINKMKKQEIESYESKMLQQFAQYLQKMVEQNEQYITHNNQKLKVNLKQINDEIQRWINS